PPGLSGRRVQVRITPREIVVHLEGSEIARHARSFIPADVVIAPGHARALRLARDARSRLAQGDVELEEVDLSRYDRLAGVDPALSEVHADPVNGSGGHPGARVYQEVG